MKFPEHFRWADAPHGYTSETGNPFGIFRISGREANGRNLKIIAVDGQETGWEHVSISLPDSPTKCPSWNEMCLVKDLFWDSTECVVQFHPPETKYVNLHKSCLHLWKCVSKPFPIPDTILV